MRNGTKYGNSNWSTTVKVSTLVPVVNKGTWYRNTNDRVAGTKRYIVYNNGGVDIVNVSGGRIKKWVIGPGNFFLTLVEEKLVLLYIDSSRTDKG